MVFRNISRQDLRATRECYRFSDAKKARHLCESSAVWIIGSRLSYPPPSSALRAPWLSARHGRTLPWCVWLEKRVQRPKQPVSLQPFIPVTLQPCSLDPVQPGFGFARRWDCWRDRVGLFVRRLRCSGSEFLEAGIVPQRIEHRIEPEQRGSERHVLRSQRASIGCREHFL